MSTQSSRTTQTSPPHRAWSSLGDRAATVQRPPGDVGGGTLVAVLAEADADLIGLREA